MPREILTSLDATKILSTERVKFIDAVCERSHSEIVYEILSGESKLLACDYCAKGARFIHHSIDHKGQNFIVLTCNNCAPKGYEILSKKRSD